MHFPAPITTLESSSAHLCSGSSINMQHQRRSPLMGQGLMPSFVQPDYVSSRAEFTGQQQQQYPALPCNRRYEHFRYHGAHLYPQTQEPYGSQQYPVQSGRHPPVTLYTNNAATKLTDGIRRRCFNCCTTDTNTWRRSKLSPGKILCNRCGLFERTHSIHRPNNAISSHIEGGYQHHRIPLAGEYPQ